MPKKVDFPPQNLPINRHASLKMFCPDLVGGPLLTVLHTLKKKVARPAKMARDHTLLSKRNALLPICFSVSEQLYIKPKFVI